MKGKNKLYIQIQSGELKSSSKYKELDQVGDLNDTINNTATESFKYARYWHGYLVFLRPLLVILNITQIRILIYIILITLAIIFLTMIYKKFGLEMTIIFLMGMIICDYFYIWLSLQGAPVFLICMISSIILLSEKIKDKKAIFLIIGGLTSFFDLLTVPLITLCIPLLLYILSEQLKPDSSYKKLYFDIAKLIIFWSIGYFGIWLFKWILVDTIYQKNLIHTAIEQINYRSISNENKEYNIIDILSRMNKITSLSLKFSIIVIILLVIFKILKLRKVKISLKKVLPYFLIVIIGFLWYCIVANHTYNHAFFTYRNLFFISISIMLVIYNFLEENKKES